MATVRVGALPDDPLAAAAEFYRRILADLSPLPFRGGAGGGVCQTDTAPTDRPHPNPSPEGEGLSDCLTLVFNPAPHAHRDWRKAAVATLAREKAPTRINAIASDDEAAITAALAWLEAAPAITGHYLPLDGTGAGLVVR